MSAETTTPKKSILTDAMERVSRKKDGEGTDETTTPKITRKQIVIGVSAVAGTAAVLITALKLFTGQKIEDETSDEVTPED